MKWGDGAPRGWNEGGEGERERGSVRGGKKQGEGGRKVERRPKAQKRETKEKNKRDVLAFLFVNI